MGNYENLSIDDINIWTDNPRIGTVMSEKDAINTLIEVVGEKKMINLAKDIHEYGLAPNELSVIVKENNHNNVYDGNRRLACLKIWKHPELVDDNRIREKFLDILQGGNGAIPATIRVYVTNKSEAHRLMDLAHSGEQEGVGRMAWSSYQRDMSLSQRNIDTIYPISYAISRALNWTRESDFNKYPQYTDIQRIFGAAMMKNYLEINNYTTLNNEQVEKISTMMNFLKMFKEEMGFKSFSRYFNTTSDNDNPNNINNLNVFFEWLGTRNNTPNIDTQEMPTNTTNTPTDSTNHTEGNDVPLTSSLTEQQPQGETNIPAIRNPRFIINISGQIIDNQNITTTVYDSIVDYKIKKLITEIEILSQFLERNGNYKYPFALVSLWRTLVEVMSKTTVELMSGGSFVFNTTTSLESLITEVDRVLSLTNDGVNINIDNTKTVYKNNNQSKRIKNHVTSVNGSIHDQNYTLDYSTILSIYNNSMPYFIACLKYIIYKRQP